jgi:hypothetical protein
MKQEGAFTYCSPLGFRITDGRRTSDISYLLEKKGRDCNIKKSSLFLSASLSIIIHINTYSFFP